MAQYSGVRVINATASVGTVDLVVLTQSGMAVEVFNVNGAGQLWFTVDHPGGTCAVPTMNGQNCFAVASVAGAHRQVRHDGQFGSVVQVISNGATEYTVDVQGNPANA